MKDVYENLVRWLAYAQNRMSILRLGKFIPMGNGITEFKENAEARLDEQGNLLLVANEVKNWKLLKRKSVKRCLELDKEFEVVKGEFVFTPPLPIQCEYDKNTEWIQLTPYGFSQCRISVFQRLKA